MGAVCRAEQGLDDDGNQIPYIELNEFQMSKINAFFAFFNFNSDHRLTVDDFYTLGKSVAKLSRIEWTEEGPNSQKERWRNAFLW